MRYYYKRAKSLALRRAFNHRVERTNTASRPVPVLFKPRFRILRDVAGVVVGHMRFFRRTEMVRGNYGATLAQAEPGT